MKKKDIGKLYQEQFESFEAPVSPQEWVSLESGMNKVNFYSFTAQHLNINYVAVAGVATVSGVAVGVYKLTQPDNVPNPVEQQIVSAAPEKKEKADSVLYLEHVDSMTKYSAPTIENKSVQKNKNNPLKENDPLSKDTISTLHQETIKVKDSSATQKTAPRNVVYINKRDTIVIKDTLDAPPINKRKKKTK